MVVPKAAVRYGEVARMWKWVGDGMNAEEGGEEVVVDGV